MGNFMSSRTGLSWMPLAPSKLLCKVVINTYLPSTQFALHNPVVTFQCLLEYNFSAAFDRVDHFSTLNPAMGLNCVP